MSQSMDMQSRSRQIGWVVAAPIAAVVARLLWVPFDEEDSGRYLTELARSPVRADAGAFLMILSALLLIPAAFALAAIVKDRAPRMGQVATGMIAAGVIGMSILSSLGLVAGTMAADPDQAAMVRLWDSFFNGSKGELLFLPVLVGVFGFMVLAIGLYRSGDVPRAAAVLTGVGGAALLFTTGGPGRGLLVTAAVLALAGFGWVAASSGHGSPVAVAPAANGRNRRAQHQRA